MQRSVIKKGAHILAGGGSTDEKANGTGAGGFIRALLLARGPSSGATVIMLIKGLGYIGTGIVDSTVHRK